MFKNWVTFGLKLALTGGLMWLLLRKIDIHAAWEAGRSVAPSMFLASILLLLQIALCTLRWRIVLAALGTSLDFKRAASIFWIGNFFGLILPGAVGGDAVRMWQTRQAGLTLSNAVNSVMLERVATVFGLILLVAATEPALAGRLADKSGLWVFPVLSLLSVLGIAFLMVLDAFPESLRRWRLVRGLVQLAHDTRRLFLKPGWAGLTMGVVIIAHVNLALGVYVLAAGLGAPVSALDCVVLVPPVILAATLPISIAGWGAREAAMVTFLGLVGVAPAQALAVSVLFGLVTTLTALPGGLLWLAARGRAGLPKEDPV